MESFFPWLFCLCYLGLSRVVISVFLSCYVSHLWGHFNYWVMFFILSILVGSVYFEISLVMFSNVGSHVLPFYFFDCLWVFVCLTVSQPSCSVDIWVEASIKVRLRRWWFKGLCSLWYASSDRIRHLGALGEGNGVPVTWIYGMTISEEFSCISLGGWWVL